MKNMSEKRFIRNIMGNIYDSEKDKWFEEDWKGKPLDYDDDLIVFLNEQQDTINRLQRKCFELEKDYLIETSDISDKIYLEDEIKKLKKEYGVIDDE